LKREIQDEATTFKDHQNGILWTFLIEEPARLCRSKVLGVSALIYAGSRSESGSKEKERHTDIGASTQLICIITQSYLCSASHPCRLYSMLLLLLVQRLISVCIALDILDVTHTLQSSQAHVMLTSAEICREAVHEKQHRDLSRLLAQPKTVSRGRTGQRI
jgi:hypothetical protein